MDERKLPRLLKRLLRARRVLALATALAGLSAGSSAMAVDRLVLTVGRVSAPFARLEGVRLAVDVARHPDGVASVQRLRIRRAGLPTVADLRLSCAALALDPRDLACRSGRLTARAGALGALSATMAAELRPATHTWRLDVRDVPLAAGRVSLQGRLRPAGWRAEIDATGVDLRQAARIARPWARLPAGYQASGHADLRLAASDDGGALTARIAATGTGLDLSNGPGTVVAQQVSATLTGTLTRRAGDLTWQGRLRGSAGQTLAGPVLLDLTANPLSLSVALARRGDGPVTVSRLDLEQRDLVRASARGIVQLSPQPRIVSGRVQVAQLRLPAAYTSYLQLALATTALGSLQSSGTASGSLDIANDAVTRLACSLHDVSFKDPTARVLLRDASGEIHWAAAPGAALPESAVSWKLAAAYGLAGGPVRLRFVTWHRNFALLGGDTRLPVFDGAVIVHTLVAQDLGTSAAKVDFDADVTPISMPRLSQAFGWPRMSGALAGHIPLVRYHDHELTFDGNLVARVFDGSVTGSHIVLENPLGPWPSLSADVLARGLDLDLVTHTFAFGSMTGRIDVDVRGLKLFDWSPVAFDARLYTTPGDRSPHRISQNAVTRIAGLGGAAGAVTAALESGVLRFFHTFHYARVGIGCRLRNEVCAMSGAGAAPNGGYYLVRGSGLPRLDIIGNVRRVDWPRLIGQIGEGMREHDIIVK